MRKDRVVTDVPAQLSVRVEPELAARFKALARRRRVSLSEGLRGLIRREVSDERLPSDSMPDEAAIRETAILLGVEHAIKLLEAGLPQNVVNPQKVLEEAARAAIARLETVADVLTGEANQ